MDIFAMGANRCPYQHDAEGAMVDDAIANLVVLLSGAWVVWQGSRWPDLLVALAIAGLFTHSAVSILRQANQEREPDHCGS